MVTNLALFGVAYTLHLPGAFGLLDDASCIWYNGLVQFGFLVDYLEILTVKLPRVYDLRIDPQEFTDIWVFFEIDTLALFH
ncbi:MAG: hypothetical protein V2I33_19825 [Kangiellaceae bacterium]|jgi:hypothetical protein|nr:hypothetical protein [Kangiellaceae bacterium]